MRAYGKFVLILPMEGKDTTESGIYLLNGIGDVKNHGTVVSIGPDCQQYSQDASQSMRLKVGDKVIHGQAIKFPNGGKDYLIVKEDDILVIL